MMENSNGQHDRNLRKRRYTHSSRDACSKTDPLELPGLVVNIILECLDDRSLLTMREVCKSWNDQITSRNALWYQRCEHKHQFCFEEEKTEDKFQEYLSFHLVYHRMQTEQAFQTEEHSKALDCYHTERKIILEEWDPNFMAGFDDLTSMFILDSLKAVVGFHDQMMMVDLETQQVLWRIDIRGLKLMETKQSSPFILCLTDAGNLVIISLEGERRPEINCQGKLKNTDLDKREYGIHPSGRFILFVSDVRKTMYQVVYLVDVENHTATQLQLKAPDPTKRGLGPVNNVGFLSGDALSEDQLAVGVVSLNFRMAAVINTRGKVLHQAYMKTECTNCGILVRWCEEPFSGSQDLCFVKAAGQHVKKYRVRCKASRVRFICDWRKPMHQNYSPCQSMIFGDQFVLGWCDDSMKIFRVDSGHQVADLPNVFTDCLWMALPEHTSPSFQYQAQEALYRDFEHMRPDSLDFSDWRGVRFNNLQWLHGLSAASTKPDVPILIVLDRNEDFLCVRWRDDVWMRQRDDYRAGR